MHVPSKNKNNKNNNNFIYTMGSIKMCKKLNVSRAFHVFLYKIEEMAAGKMKPQDLDGVLGV